MNLLMSLWVDHKTEFRHQKHNSMILFLETNYLNLCLKSWVFENLASKKYLTTTENYTFFSIVETNFIKIREECTSRWFFEN